VTPDGIAIIPIEGTLVHKAYGMDAVSGMRSYIEIQQEIEDAATDPAVKGILLDVDSPGGEVAGIFELADTIHSARSAKPILSVANSNALSGAYLLASGAQRVYAGQSSCLQHRRDRLAP
jgi:ClpP class serine protease